MVRGFVKQPQGVAAYQKHGFQYEDEVYDAVHEKFMKQTAGSPEQLNICYIPNIRRIKTATGEYLTYTLMYRRTDSLGNWKHSFLSNLGIIPKLQPVTRMRRDDEGWETKYIAHLDLVGKEYIIPWEGKKTMQKLMKEYGEDCIRDRSTEEGLKRAAEAQQKREKYAEEHGKTLPPLQDNAEWTSFLVHRAGEHYKIPIHSYNDFLTGDFEELYRHSKIRTPIERKYDEMKRFGRELTDQEREIEKSVPYIVGPGNKLDQMTETAELEMKKARGEEVYK